MNIETLIKYYPTLWHMAARGSWSIIREYGLLSTSHLLWLFEVSEDVYEELVCAHRPHTVRIENREIGVAHVRDQKPMSDSGLERALEDNLSPVDWYGILNAKCFFWLNEERLNRMLCARAYRDYEHDIIIVDTESLVEEYADRILLSPINSGCTKPFPHPRGLRTFQRIEDFDFCARQRGRRISDVVVELAVEGGVQNIADFVVGVERRRANETLNRIL